MAAIRITKEQVEAAAAARERALIDDPELRRFEEELAKEMEAAEQKKKNGKEAD